MRVRYIAFDSYGVKSSCIRVETRDVTIVVDPGIASERSSFPLPREERRALRQRYEVEIRHACSDADVIVITHYHYDHHIPDQRLYKGKRLLIKDPEHSINRSQRWRAGRLLEGLEADVEVADGEVFTYGSTEIRFSKPYWHGVEGSKLGYVIMISIDDGERRLLHTSDIDGPVLREVADEIIEVNPDILIIDGPPTYLLGFIFAYYNLARSIVNLCHIIEESRAETIVLDHHLVRDYRFPELLHPVYRKARELDRRVCTAAELRGLRPMVLEAYRRYGPTRWRDWSRLNEADVLRILEEAVEKGLIEDEWIRRLEEVLDEDRMG